MAICYSENTDRDGIKIDLDRINAVKMYLKHYYNLMYLSFIAEKSDSFSERVQANNEIAICRRKLAYWERHKNYILEEALRGVERIKKEWGK